MKNELKKILITVLLSVIILFLFIIRIEYKFRNNIVIGMKPNEIESIYGKPDLLSEDSTDLIYTYRSFWNKTVFVFSKEDNNLKTKWRENWCFIYGNEINN